MKIDSLLKYVGVLVLVQIVAAVAFDLSAMAVPSWLMLSLLVVCCVAGGLIVFKQKLQVYVTKRIIEAIAVTLVIATLTFVLLRFLPGGPFDQEKALPAEIKANIEAKYGLNDSLTKQYLRYINGILHFDFGESYKYIGRSVTDIVKETLPVSFQLGFYSLVLAFIIGIPLGVFAASKHNSLWDSSTMLFAISGVALPSFVVGPLLVLFFSFGVPFSALQGSLPPALWDGPLYYILPVITLGIRPAAIIARLTRSSMLEVIQSDFVRTARAKGVAENIVLYKHVLKNSLIPVLTFSGPLIAGILSGSFVIEIIFAIPGMGKHLVQSVTNRDYPLILGVTLIYSVMLVFANLVVDLLYTIADPRIKLT